MFFSQLVDDGLFLSFYLGGEYPRGYFYNKESVVFSAYSQDFRLTWEIASERGDTRALSSMTDSELADWLATFGLGQIELTDGKPLDTDDLADRWKARQERFKL